MSAENGKKEPSIYEKRRAVARKKGMEQAKRAKQWTSDDDALMNLYGLFHDRRGEGDIDLRGDK